ncbi:MAG: glycosyltransferase [Lachnospiraceae bacterium]|nr:glycosyltransferase [Lachnospiraceae bacterium]
METKVDEILETLALSDEKRAGVSQLKNDLKYGGPDLPWQTDCFLVSWLKDELAAAGQFDAAVLAALGTDIENRMPFLKKMLSHQKEYSRFLQKASPYVFLVGDDICYGVLEDFSRKFGAAFEKMGYRVIYQDRQRIPEVYEQMYEGTSYRGIFGMQDPLLSKKLGENEYFFGKVNAPLYLFSFDHPAGFYDFIYDSPEDMVVLTLDRYYAEYVEKYFHRKAFLFPPGGEKPAHVFKDFEEFKADAFLNRKYDLSFLGSYGTDIDEHVRWIRENEPKLYPIASRFVGHMLKETNEPSEMAFRRAVDDMHMHVKNQEKNEPLSDENFSLLFNEWVPMEKSVASTFRNRIVRQVASSGIEFHIYGNDWEKIGEYPCFHVHEPLSYEKAKQVYNNSWLSLNVMTWHKAGFTERIAESQLRGSLVVTDSTEYLRENYTDGDDIIMYDLSDESIAELPNRLKALLSDKDHLMHIAYNGYQNALAHHTWDTRAEEFIKMTV